MINIVEIFSEICDRVKLKTGLNVNYQFGDWAYMAKILTEMGNYEEIEAMKYPLIGLFSPFEEDKSNKDIYCSTRLNLIIATQTLPDYTNEQRLGVSFKPILHPVYEALIEAIKKDRRFDFGYNNEVVHKYTDNYRYGSKGVYGEGENPFRDMIDGIDIKDLEIIVKKQTCRI